MLCLVVESPTTGADCLCILVGICMLSLILTNQYKNYPLFIPTLTLSLSETVSNKLFAILR